ncbi:MAG: hypothetical protein WAO41_07210 [Candidatus Nanopelagicales bacterium]
MTKPDQLLGQVIATHVWPPHTPSPTAVDHLELDWGGPIGDRHHGLTMTSDTRQKVVFARGTTIRNHRQVSVVDIGELAQISANLGIDHLAPGVIADNIATSGLDELTAMPPMTRLVFSGGVVLMTGGANLPCVIAGQLVVDSVSETILGGPGGTPPTASAFVKAAFTLRGITGWVEHPGSIRPGEQVRAILP